MLGKLLGKSRPNRADVGDDPFADTRMSFGDHLEELRSRMWRAIKGLGLCLVIGFIMDQIGDYTGKPWIGVGKPMLKIITDPVEEQVKEFYHKRNELARKKLEETQADANEQRNKMVEVRTKLPVQPLLDSFEGLKLKDTEQKEIEFVQYVNAGQLHTGANEGEHVLGTRKFLTGLGVMEAFMVYIKVSLLCGVVIACPWIFWQMWSFIGAGLYPQEKKLVHVYLPFSVILFMGGCVLCQFVVMPRAVSAMLGFYDWINIDPDLRLNEWLGFAIVMPLVFGVSFQTPLVMLFFNRIGVFTWEQYLAKWRYAIFVLAVAAALLTPSTDVISMLWLFIPTFGLYMIGILICYMLPPPNLFGPVDEDAEVGV